MSTHTDTDNRDLAAVVSAQEARIEALVRENRSLRKTLDDIGAELHSHERGITPKWEELPTRLGLYDPIKLDMKANVRR